jgi:hypothetical protein
MSSTDQAQFSDQAQASDPALLSAEDMVTCFARRQLSPVDVL